MAKEGWRIITFLAGDMRVNRRPELDPPIASRAGSSFNLSPDNAPLSLRQFFCLMQAPTATGAKQTRIAARYGRMSKTGMRPGSAPTRLGAAILAMGIG